jgi:hypothetical protein
VFPFGIFGQSSSSASTPTPSPAGPIHLILRGRGWHGDKGPGHLPELEFLNNQASNNPRGCNIPIFGDWCFIVVIVFHYTSLHFIFITRSRVARTFGLGVKSSRLFLQAEGKVPK